MTENERRVKLSFERKCLAFLRTKNSQANLQFRQKVSFQEEWWPKVKLELGYYLNWVQLLVLIAIASLAEFLVEFYDFLILKVGLYLVKENCFNIL